MEIMTERRFRHLPVMQNDQLCCMVSIGDLVNYRIHWTERKEEALKTFIRGGQAKKTIICNGRVAVNCSGSKTFCFRKSM